jgi:hypothetical protein
MDIGEGSLRNITRLNFSLMITRPKINFGEDLGSSQLIKQHVNAGKGVFIFDGDQIERAVVYAQSQATVFHLDKESWTSPRRRTRADKTLKDRMATREGGSE